MKFAKILVYTALIIVMTSSTGDEHGKLVLFVFLGMLYFDARDTNIRSLVVIIAMVEFIFYELDYLFYTLGKYYWLTGPVMGDVILDILILLGIVFSMASVYYRCEIIDLVTPLFGLEKFEYMPTRADLTVLYALRAIGLYHIVMLCIKVSIIYDYNLAIKLGLVSASEIAFARLREFGVFYVKWGFKVELIKYVALVLSLHVWLKKSIPAGRTKIGVFEV